MKMRFDYCDTKATLAPGNYYLYLQWQGPMRVFAGEKLVTNGICSFNLANDFNLAHDFNPAHDFNRGMKIKRFYPAI
ncbi:MAG: hypothetical protein EOO68_32370 [Moraxellaceae bacterium]|nr:MAG: hypothetical protein EOO68_32370 [Moraxellaceae bacterium]